MASFDAAYIPDDLWQKFESGEIDYFVYNDRAHTAAVHFADGRDPVEFSAAATVGMREEERQRRHQAALDRGAIVYEGKMRVSVYFGKGFLWNAGT